MSYLVLFLAILGAVFALPIWLEARRRPIDDMFRAQAPGTCIKLSQGITHYQWHGSARGKVLVAIHGLTTPSQVWQNLAEDFGRIGYRVLTYDLYGRGFSDAPKGLQDEAFFAQQLNDLLEHLEIEDAISVVGYSMGGSIATTFAAENTHRVDQVFLIASAGFDVTESRFSRFCRQTPLIGDWIYDVLAAGRMRRGLLAETAVSEVEGLADIQIAELSRQGFVRSVLSSRRGMLAQSIERSVRTLARRNVPIFAVWGDDDPVIPVSSVGRLAEWHRGARQEVIDGADHAVAYSHGGQVFSAFKALMGRRT